MCKHCVQAPGCRYRAYDLHLVELVPTFAHGILSGLVPHRDGSLLQCPTLSPDYPPGVYDVPVD